MRLVVLQFVSLDGVCQGPGSPEEDRSDGFERGGWLTPHLDEQFVRQTSDWLDQADGLLLGRRTYLAFGRDWPAITDPSDPWAARMNSLPKYVVSNSLTEAGWGPATVLSGDVGAKVAELKEKPGRELQIHGSARLSRSLFEAGLVDELRLMVAPVVVGAGRRFFLPGTAAGLKLSRYAVTPAGVTVNVYEYAGEPKYSTYGS